VLIWSGFGGQVVLGTLHPPRVLRIRFQLPWFLHTPLTYLEGVAPPEGGPQDPSPRTLAQDLKMTHEFRVKGSSSVGLAALRDRFGAKDLHLSKGGDCLVTAEAETIGPLLRSIGRVIARWALALGDSNILAALGYNHRATIEVPPPARRSPFSPPLGHPFHWVERSLEPSLVVFAPVSITDQTIILIIGADNKETTDRAQEMMIPPPDPEEATLGSIFVKNVGSPVDNGAASGLDDGSTPSPGTGEEPMTTFLPSLGDAERNSSHVDPVHQGGAGDGSAWTTIPEEAPLRQPSPGTPQRVKGPLLSSRESLPSLLDGTRRPVRSSRAASAPMLGLSKGL
jgi:hypothetical protein